MKQRSLQLQIPEATEGLHLFPLRFPDHSAKLLETFFNGTLTAVALLDRDFNFLRVNHAYARICGRAVEDFPGRNHFDLFPSDALTIFKQVRSSKVPYEAHGRPFTFADHAEWGETYWDWTLVPVVDERGKVSVFLLSLHDVTEQTQHARENEVAVALLHLANEAEDVPELANAICAFIQDWSGCEAIALRLRQGDDFPLYHAIGLTDDFHKAEYSLCGFDERGCMVRDEQGKPLLQCLCGSLISGRAKRRSRFYTAHGSFFAGNVDDYVAQTREKDLPEGLRGRCMEQGYKSLAMVPLRLGEEVIGLLHLCHTRPHAFPRHMIDALERLGESLAVALAHRQKDADLQQHERQYRDLVENVDSIVIRISPDGTINFCNSYACQFFGYKPQELIGKKLTDTIVPPVDSTGADLETRMANILAEPEKYRSQENENVTRKGERVWVMWRNEPVYDEAGEFRELLSIGNDLTEHKRTEQQLLDYQNKLRSLALQLSLAEEQERHRISDAIHDDIVQDLAFTKMQLAMLGKKPLRAEVAPVVQELYDGVVDVIQRLRTLSFELSPSVLYRLGLAAAAEWLTERVVERSRFKAHVEAHLGDAEIPQELQVTAYQCLRELLTNAAKHSKAKKVLVSLDAQNGTLMIEVRDDGIGFDPQQVRPPNAGGGYGLFSLQERLTHLGGRLIIESAPGEGARFLLIVPLRNQ
ncbi:MAG: PAS domain S-box protein [Armatimonadia bacterium]